ncbi:MAG: hypothetical protein AABX70_09195 [Nanoarchaeota archaeon]
MKKLLTVAVAGIFSAFLAACSSQAPSEQTRPITKRCSGQLPDGRTLSCTIASLERSYLDTKGGTPEAVPKKREDITGYMCDTLEGAYLKFSSNPNGQDTNGNEVVDIEQIANQCTGLDGKILETTVEIGEVQSLQDSNIIVVGKGDYTVHNAAACPVPEVSQWQPVLEKAVADAYLQGREIKN